MLWIKRNLWVLAAGLVALGLIGFGVYFLDAQLGTNADLDTQLGQTKTELNRLIALPDQPTSQNLEATRRELTRAKVFLAESRKLFPTTRTDPVNNQSFKTLLETTVAQLRGEAAVARTKLQTNYNFSFEAQVGPVNFEPASLRPMSEALAEIKMISSTLFQAKIERLEQIRRVQLSRYDLPTSPDILAKSYWIDKDTDMAIWPYEFKFDCFSPALASVIENLSRSPSGAVIKSVSVEPVPVPLTGRPPLSVNTVTNKLTTVLDEKLMRITLVVDIIKPQPPGR